ncbi:MAG: TrbG/VirB9 family P-type conjugative transfer protein [Alphaproteobacteria bacterium]|nr:TrbG/VirB9 family P-type conjugative transfer protein [Alphaproteobacteria bacterium]
MKKSLKFLLIILSGMLLSNNGVSKLLEEEGSLDQYAEQSQGNYQPMNMNYAGFNNLGMIQEAWQDPLQNLGEGQSKPAYSKYYWSPDLVLPVRLREGMMTLINFPEWELIESVKVGDTGSFTGTRLPHAVILQPKGGRNGVDTNILVFGRSGNVYAFYARSEAYNTERLTNSIVDIEVLNGDSSENSGRGAGATSGGFGNLSSGTGDLANPAYTRRFLKEDWLRSIPMDPEKFRFDVEIYVPNPDDVIIAPERVWHDDIFTYIDLGEKALNMVQRPIVTMIIERSETPIGFRTKGPNNRLIIVEGVGDMVMRSGKRMVCLKLRRSDDEGMQYVTYADTSNEWDIAPAIPSGKKSSANSGSEGANSGNGGYIKGPNGGLIVPNAAQNSLMSMNITSDNSAMSELPAMNCSGNNCNITGGKNIANPYPQYKYGSGFSGQSGESLSIELGTDDSVNNLEKLWKDLSGRYSGILGGYEPFYSVDAPADGQGKELFHLRVGPIQNLEAGDSICGQLGRGGVFCSVVRTQ